MTPEDRAYEATHEPEPRWTDCPECRGEGHVLLTPLEIEEVCPRCSGTGLELDDGTPPPPPTPRPPDPEPAPGSIEDLQRVLARVLRYHLELAYGTIVSQPQALDVAAQQCAGVTEWLRRHLGKTEEED